MKDISSAQEIEIRIDDLCRLSEKRGKACFTAFLNEQEQYFAERLLNRRKDICYSFFGGDESCVRRMLRVSAYEDDEEFPIYPLTVRFRKADTLGHRDFLGSFMSLGIGREQIGDIYVSEGCGAVFCTKTARDLILNISSIGRVGVTVTDGLDIKLPEQRFEEATVIMASLRADCFVAAVTGLSREKSADFIKAGYMTLNYTENTNVSKTLSEGDTVSLRGYGKFTVCEEAGVTKKNRLRVQLKKYS